MIEIDHWELDHIERDAEDLKNVFPELSRSRYVPGEGDNPQAFIIGEAPGAQEEMKGRPFVGPCKVLRQLMEFADLYSEHRSLETGEPNCWLTNVVKFRPPRNRAPTETEIKAFRPLLLREWKAVGSPRLIIPIGGVALWAVTGKRMSILKAAGKCHYYSGRNTGKGGPTMAIWPMVHPAFALRQGPAVQELVERDWEKLADWRRNNGR